MASDQVAEFYFCALQARGRIKVGDTILIDPNCDITPCSIVLTKQYNLQNARHAEPDEILGKVVQICIPI